MRLRRVEAVRYGRLFDRSLGDLGDGLTVVTGPNEAGKSTFTALVRHALYGFPTHKDSDPGYFVSGKGRLVRLVFEDGTGRWAIEREEGPHGGLVTVRALAGENRPGLLQELTRGVSGLAYRVVFGFGLAEMARIEELRGSKDDIIARLNAASAGLTVSPHEVRAALQAEAEALFKPRGQKPEVNALLARLRAVRKEIHELRRHADAFREDQQRLKALEEELAHARAARDDKHARAVALAVALGRVDERLRQIEEHDRRLLELRRERKRLDDEAVAVVVDEAVLDAAPQLDAALEEAAGFGELLAHLRDAEERLAAAARHAREAEARTGLDDERLVALRGDAVRRVAVEQAGDDLKKLELVLETREEAAARAADALEQAERAAKEAAEQVGVTGPDAADALRERLAALDAVEAARAGAVLPDRASVGAPALVMLISGVAAVATGVYFRQWATVAIGALLVAAAAVFLVRGRARGAVADATDERPYLELLGLPRDAGPLDLARTRRALESALAACEARDAARRASEEAARDAGRARDALATRTALWVEWLTSRGLPADLAPAEAANVLLDVQEALKARDAEADARAEAERVAERVREFASRLAEAARPFVEVAEPLAADAVPVVANRLKDLLAQARSAAARRAELLREVAALTAAIATEEERLAQAQGDLREVLEAWGLAEGGTHDDLRVMKQLADDEAAEAERALEALTTEAALLAERLERESTEQRGGELRLEAAGLAERLADAVEHYLVLATSARLLGRAQERYERERQPEVVKEAERVFSRITGHAYTHLAVPLGDGRIEVFDERGQAKTSDVLSRGTAEQLYLAMRLGLIAQLGDAGSGLPVLMDDVLVNFDPERRRGAAEAVAELATARQVVFFTCHPETAALFAEVAPDHVRLDLGACVR